jgi:hypothetical protein
MNNSYFFIVIRNRKTNEQWLLHNNEFIARETKEQAKNYADELEWISELAADIFPAEMTIEELETTVGVPFSIHNIRVGNLSCKGALVINELYLKEDK